MTYIFLYQPSIYMGTYDVTNNKTDYINFGDPAYQKEPTSNEYSVVKLENNYDKATETSLVTLSVDGEQVFAKLNTQGRYGSHGSSLTASDYEQYALEKLNFTFNYLGGNRDGGDTPAWKLSNTFDYIKVTTIPTHMVRPIPATALAIGRPALSAVQTVNFRSTPAVLPPVLQRRFVKPVISRMAN